MEEQLLMSVFEQRTSNYRRVDVTATEVLHVEDTSSVALRAAIDDGGVGLCSQKPQGIGTQHNHFNEPFKPDAAWSLQAQQTLALDFAPLLS